MPRTPKRVNPKSLTSKGAVDLHFHGAFGTDVCHATPAELGALARGLWTRGVAAFAPTTLTQSWPDLQAAIQRLGAWIQKRWKSPAPGQGALPLGIHLEGPYLQRNCCGAHPQKDLRTFKLQELEHLWELSQGTLKVLTACPLVVGPKNLRPLARFTQKHGILLLMGHTSATEAQAREAFEAGFMGITHAWNALPFHHREPGALGAALGDPKLHVELIPDGVHVHPTVRRWTHALHPNTYWVSDATPAVAARGLVPWGPLKVRVDRGASRTPDGSLAGGGTPLPQMAAQAAQDLKSLLSAIQATTQAPLAALPKPWPPGLQAHLTALPLRWELTPRPPRTNVRPLQTSPV